MKIGERVIRKICKQVEEATRARLSEVDYAYMAFGGEPFQLGYTSKLKPSKYGGVEVVTKLKFKREPEAEETAISMIVTLDIALRWVSRRIAAVFLGSGSNTYTLPVGPTARAAIIVKKPMLAPIS